MTNFKETADEILMKYAAAGEQGAFAALVQRHQNPLVNFFRRLGVYTDAEDLVQETFIRLYKYRVRYQPTAKFTTFLYMMARQVRIDYLRKLGRRRELNNALTDEHAVPKPVLDPARHRKADAVEALLTLSEEMRSVVVLNIYQGLRYKEISEILEIPEGTVKTRMFHALRKLREAIEDEE